MKRRPAVAALAGFLAGIAVFVGMAVFVEAVLIQATTIQPRSALPRSQTQLHIDSGLYKAVKGLPTFGVGMSGIGVLLALWADMRRRESQERGREGKQSEYGPWPAETVSVVLVRGICAGLTAAAASWVIQLGWAHYLLEPATACAAACIVSGLVLYMIPHKGGALRPVQES